MKRISEIKPQVPQQKRPVDVQKPVEASPPTDDQVALQLPNFDFVSEEPEYFDFEI